MAERIEPQRPDEVPTTPRDAHDTIKVGSWDGPTYYGRAQLKPSPFNNYVVGSYIFAAGLAGGAALISAVADLSRGPRAAGLVRRGRYISLLAPLAAPLLIWDLHTPQRFANMMRIAKRTSPMSIGTWILLAFCGPAVGIAAAQAAADWWPGWRWLRSSARVGQVPAAVAGAGLSTYTAALLAATSTPLWAAAPRALAVRFGASSVAAGAAALSLGERSSRNRRSLDALAIAALAAELVATRSSHDSYRRTGVAPALDNKWGRVEHYGATGLGTVAPLVLQTASLAFRRPGRLSTLASLAVLAGSAALRLSIMSAGDVSAERPDISFRFAQPDNLPE